MNPEKLQKAENDGIHRFFKLHSSLGLTSMVKYQIDYNLYKQHLFIYICNFQCAFDKDSVLKKYDSTMQIMRDFYDVRLEFYGKRKSYLEGILGAEAAKLTNQAR